MFKKLLVNEWFKEYTILNVTKECFNDSPEIETVGSMTGFKIHSLKDLNFRIKTLKEHGFKENKNE